MTREEILAVTINDDKGCEAIDMAVHAKLRLCWHHWEISRCTSSRVTYTCTNCESTQETSMWFKPPGNPHYTNDIQATGRIKLWLDVDLRKVPPFPSAKRHVRYLNTLKSLYPRNPRLPTYDDVILHSYMLIWASPLDRCKAFLLMDDDKIPELIDRTSPITSQNAPEMLIG
jgi:hypothetical protein